MPQLVPPGRIVGLDVARCLALLGMIATHALVSTTPEGDTTVVQQVAGGRASALFAVLAGASLALVSGRTEPVAGADALRVARSVLVRAAAVAVIGLVLGALDTTIAVILTYYGVLFVLGIPFLTLRARPLAVLAGTGVLVLPMLSQLVRPLLPPPSYDSPHPAMLLQPAHLLSELLFTGYYPALTWLPYLLAGMAIGRLDLRRRGVGVALAVGGAVVALAAKAASTALLALPGVYDVLERTWTGSDRLEHALEHGMYGTTPTTSWWWLAVSAPHSGAPFDLAHTIGTSALVVGVCVLVAPLAPRVFAVLFGAGAMTLTLYSLHVVMRIPQAWPDDDAETFARHVALVLVIGAVYRLAGRSGPLERVLAWLQRQAAGPRPVTPVRGQ